LLTDGSPPNVNTGWVEIMPDPDSPTPAGLGVLSLRRGGTLVTEAGFAAVTPTTHAIIYVDEANGHDTRLAIANPKTSPSPIVSNAYRADGGAVMSTSSNLAGEGHDAKFAWQLMPGALLQGFTGVLEITGTEGFVALALRALTNSRGEYLFTAIPITDLDHFVPGPLIFPQVADGGGYETQFVFLSSGASPTITLKFFGDDGAPIKIAR
jgi:hypothetical protein